MRKIAGIFVTQVLVMAFGASLALAQSSGNFSFAGFSGTCTISDTGQFGGNGACLASTDTDGCEILNAPITVSNGNGTTLLITPSAVTGLFTDTKINTNNPSTSASVGVQVCVEVDGSGANVLGGDVNGCAMYDERFQQISTNLFSTITECADPAASCNFDLILSTLSAHSYNFVVQVPGGTHTITAEWSVVNAATSNGNGSVAACMGPGNITVTQTKVFNNSGQIIF